MASMNLHLLLALVTAAALGACAQSLNEQLQGQPVAVAVDRLGGAPANAFDLPDGRRVFEWNSSDMLVIEGNAYDHDPRWWTIERKPLEGSSIGHCINQVIARWNSVSATWTVERYRIRWKEGCSMRRPRTSS